MYKNTRDVKRKVNVMKVIDIHAHIYEKVAGITQGQPMSSTSQGKVTIGNREIQFLPPSFERSCSTAEALIAYMDWCGIEKALLMPNPFYGYHNYYFKESVKKYPDRLRGVALVDIMKGKAAAEELAQIYDEGILFGMKIEVDSTFQCAPGTRLADPRLAPVWDCCEQYHQPMFIHMFRREDLITKKVDAIVITAASPTALAPVVEEATEAGIKVVSFDNVVDTDEQVATVGIDETEFGRIGAEWLAEKLDGKGKIIVLNGIAGAATDSLRWGGAEEVFKNYPDIEVLGSANASWDYAQGKAAVESMLSAYPEIDGVWSQGGAMTQGAIDAFIAAGRDLVPMTSEGNNGALKAWYENRDNGLSCIAPSNPTYTSAEALRTVIKALDGEDVPKNVVMDIETVTEDNLEDYYRPDMPDSFWVLTELDDEALQKLYK